MGLWDRVYVRPKVDSLVLNAFHPIGLEPEEFGEGCYEPTLGERRNPDMKNYYIVGKMEIEGGKTFPFHKDLAVPNKEAIPETLDFWIKEHNKNKEPKDPLWVKVLTWEIGTKPLPKKEEPGPKRNTHPVPPGVSFVHGKKTKVCSTCGQERPMEDYYSDKKTQDGRKSQCKFCINKNRKDQKERKAMGTDKESLLAQPRGQLSEMIERNLVEPPRKHEIDGEIYIHLGDLINVLRGPRRGK